MKKKTRSKTRGRTRAENAIGARESEGRQEKWPHSCCRPQAAAKGAPLQTPPEGESALSVFGCRLCVAGGAEGERRQAADRPTLAPTLCVCVCAAQGHHTHTYTHKHTRCARTHTRTHTPRVKALSSGANNPPPSRQMCVLLLLLCVCALALPCREDEERHGGAEHHSASTRTHSLSRH